MKSFKLTVLAILFGSLSYAQTNTFPSSGNVGIGTTTPGALLHIHNNSIPVFRLSNSTYSSELKQDSYVTTVEASSIFSLKWGNSGNRSEMYFDHLQVGKFHLSTYGAFVNGWGGFKVAHNEKFGFYTHGSTNSYLAIGSVRTDNNNWGLTFSSKNAGTDIEAMRITNTGNVGIGTTNPGAPLEVYKSNSGALGGQIVLNNTGVAQGDQTALSFASGGVANSRAQIQSTVEGAPYYGTLEFITGMKGTPASWTEKMRITGAGKVGIGTTNPSTDVELNKTNNSGYTVLQIKNPSTASGILGAQLTLANSSSTGSVFKTGTGYTTYKSVVATDLGLYNSIAGNISILNDYGSGNINFTAGGASAAQITLLPSGKVGIGTTNPQYGNLQIASNAGDYNATMPAPVAVRVNTAGVGFVIANTGTEYTDFASGTILKGMRGHGSVPFTISNDGEIYFSPNGSEVMRLKSGNVGIGTASPSEKLAVNGNIVSKKVRVTQTGWADYVFHPSYQLPLLSEVEVYIKKHQHLPEIPSAKEVEKNGLDLGANQAALLKKIEELTLYVIEQNKRIEQLEKITNKE